MRKAVKYVAIAVAVLAVAVFVAIVTAIVLSERKLNRSIDVNAAPVAYVNTPEALAQGKYLFDTRGCGECHTPTGAGRVMIDAPNGFYVRSPNITAGGITARYTERDWVRAIRHGVKPDGKPVFLMPSEDYNRLTDADLAALVAYVRSLPQVPAGAGEVRLPLIMKAVYAFGAMKDAAEKIDHSLPPSAPVAVAANVAHGDYVARMCIGCHGPGMSGGKIPGAPPSWPPAANLTPGAGSAMKVYDTPERFRAMMRTGKRPDGSEVNAVMPFASLKAMTDVDLDAMYAFLKTLPAREVGNR